MIIVEIIMRHFIKKKNAFLGFKRAKENISRNFTTAGDTTNRTEA